MIWRFIRLKKKGGPGTEAKLSSHVTDTRDREHRRNCLLSASKHALRNVNRVTVLQAESACFKDLFNLLAIKRMQKHFGG